MAQTCGQCGATLAGDAVFCSACGSQVGKGPGAAGGRRPSAETIATGEQRLLKTVRDATLGEYEIMNEIGRGGMAVVFLGHDIALNRRVAIKCMAPALMLMDKGIQERFKREARTAAGLSHPHIIPVYAVKEGRDLVYFVMKYIEGRSLESVIKEVGPLPVPVIQTILNQAGSALGHAHRNGVVHRDVKPGNIMLDQDGWLVMTDFGIAKVAQAEALTMTGGMVGTPAYMSPEQCKGNPVTGAADQYSLGVVAYEMLTGKPPFASPTMVNMIYDHCHTLPPPLAGRREDAPPELTAAVMRMLEKDPDMRFPSIEDAVAAVGVASETQDAVRTRLLTLVQSTATAKLLDKFRTPGSPVPHARAGSPAPPSQVVAAGPPTPSTPAPHLTTPAPDPGAPARGKLAPWAWAVPAAAGVVAGIFVLGRRASDPPSEAAAVTPSVTVTAPAVARLDVTPVSLALVVGSEAPLSAVPRDDSGAPVAMAVTWETLDPGIAAVSAGGVVRGVSAGQGRVVARSGGSSASVVITVAAPAPPAAARSAGPGGVASVGVAPTGLTLMVGESARLTAVPLAAEGSSLRDRRVTWTSADPRVASVTADGMVTAASPGTVAISAASEGRTGTASVTVLAAAAVASVAIEPPALTLIVGGQARLGATLRDARGGILADRTVTWRSSSAAVATVDPSGLVNAVGPGSASLVASSGQVTGSATVTVSRPVAAEPARDPRAEVGQLVERYREAIETRQVEGIRRLYPGLTAQQERAWSAFFGSVSELAARLEMTSFESAGDSARATIAAVYDFRSDRRQTQNTTFTMRFRRTATGWQIQSVQ